MHTVIDDIVTDEDSEDEKSFLVFKKQNVSPPHEHTEMVEVIEEQQDVVEPIPHNTSSEIEIDSKRIRFIDNSSNKIQTSTTATILNDYTISPVHHQSTSSFSNEFDLFAKQIAYQLQQLPLDMALDLQMQINTLVYKKRIEWVQTCGSQLN